MLFTCCRIGIRQRHVAIGRRFNNQVFRIKQERAAQSDRRGGTGRTIETQRVFTGDFDKSAVATIHTTLRRNAAGKAGVLIAPDDNLAAIATSCSISFDERMRVERSVLGVGNAGVATLIITAYQYLAASTYATGVKTGGIKINGSAGH